MITLSDYIDSIINNIKYNTLIKIPTIRPTIKAVFAVLHFFSYVRRSPVL